jgi:hypothetical protein
MQDYSATLTGLTACNQTITMTPKPGYRCCPACDCATKSCYNFSDANTTFTLCLGTRNGGAYCYSAPSTAVWRSTVPPFGAQCSGCVAGHTKVAYGIDCGTDRYGNPALYFTMYISCCNCTMFGLNCTPCNLPFGSPVVGLESGCSPPTEICYYDVVLPLTCASATFSVTPPGTIPCPVACVNNNGVCPDPTNCPTPTVGAITGS